MPVMDGHESTRRIRAWEAEQANAAQLAGDKPRRPAYIIALTAHAGDDHKAECFADGFDDFTTKPITPQSVRLALGRYAAKVAGEPAAPGA